MGILSVDLNNINLDDANFYEDDPKTIVHDRFWFGIIHINNTKQ